MNVTVAVCALAKLDASIATVTVGLMVSIEMFSTMDADPLLPAISVKEPFTTLIDALSISEFAAGVKIAV